MTILSSLDLTMPPVEYEVIDAIKGACAGYTFSVDALQLGEQWHSDIYIARPNGEELVDIRLCHQKRPADGEAFTAEAVEVAAALMWSAIRYDRFCGRDEARQ